MTRGTARQALAPVSVVVLVLAVVAAAGNHRWQGTRLTADVTAPRQVFVSAPIQGTATARSAAPRLQPLHIPDWIPIVMVGLLALVGLFAVALVVRALLPVLRRLLRWRPPAAAPAMPGDGALDPGLRGFADHLREGADEAAIVLERSDRTSADAVIACWLRLEDAAARTGLIRQPWQTPSEFTSALLLSQRADPDACADLLGLYQRARFGHEHLGPVDTAAAAAALRRIALTVSDAPGSDPTDALAAGAGPSGRTG